MRKTVKVSLFHKFVELIEPMLHEGETINISTVDDTPTGVSVDGLLDEFPNVFLLVEYRPFKGDPWVTFEAGSQALTSSETRQLGAALRRAGTISLLMKDYWRGTAAFLGVPVKEVPMR